MHRKITLLAIGGNALLSASAGRMRETSGHAVGSR
jgi:hypothetical protein